MFVSFLIKDFTARPLLFYLRCSSYVGNVNQGSQNVNIGPSCEQVATVVHELLHALGFLHEHTRLDRDDFVFINLTNVQTGTFICFEKSLLAKNLA